MTIQSFRSDQARAIFEGRGPGKGFPSDLIRATKRKLEMLEATPTLEALRLPPNNRLEALKGDLADRHSIRVNDQFRLVFRWLPGGPAEVDFVDYHGSEPAPSGAQEDRMSAKAATDPLGPVHPGEMLAEEFLKPLGLSAGAAAARMGVPRTRIERLLGRTTRMTPDTALRLERLLGMPAEFWLNLQLRYDLLTARAALPVSIRNIERLEPAR